mmetsp:Transcript_11896/g.17749  ORF Transcript_11896/g.17749 Transcript_11896/m.17749 type:complete len:177 (+) Transcript_11896:90-620(+)|eukprot:CAMPEP_0171458264 /NCGR_PEP_ID=MMETSP0945-20130129/4014_1 /TAXON_ID=109269 /ORGANISM="Vaucheria litorea, Strain CCMP2940" /LENGTH=176 /DNA_ID=CAMNT_0011984041 /DNA_START=52 /DNA_END=582 /DNA_ORIENTATION=+
MEKSKITPPPSPTLIEWTDDKGRIFRFLIFESPNDKNISFYLEEFKKHNVSAVVRACDKTYDPTPFVKEKFEFHEMEYKDGSIPPPETLQRWLDLVHSTFKHNKSNQKTIAVHCIAGLGRSPLLVVLALIYEGMDHTEAIEYVRERRKGAFNLKHMSAILRYKPKHHHKGDSCSIN